MSLGGVRRAAGKLPSLPSVPPSPLLWEAVFILARRPHHICRPAGSGQLLVVYPPDAHRQAARWIRRIDDPERAGCLDSGLVGRGTGWMLATAKRHAEHSYRRDPRVFAIADRSPLTLTIGG